MKSEAPALPAESEPEPAQPPAQAELVSEPVVEVKDVAESPPKQPAAPKAEKTPAASKPRQAKANRKLSKKEQRKKKAEEKLHKAFSDYFEYNEEIKKIPPHRILAINRGERGKVLRIRVECNIDAMYAAIDEFCVPPEHPHSEFLRGCARDALTRLVLPSLEREIRRELTERAETHAVGVFARNLRNLLLQPPIRERRVLAVDPGYRSGCKLAALDQFGNPLFHDVIYLVGRAERREEAKRTVTELIDRFDLSVVTIGNGTACREAEDFFAGLIAEDYKGKGLAYVIVNEAGASVYSTSRLGREEFPEYDASLRGAISIGRRLQDPLSELVKIDPASIGVGLYQHDVKAKHLRVSLDEVVESCVNYVGVDVNTASPALLRYVSGLNQLTARRVYEHRLRNGPFRSREQLRAVPGFGEATFVQAAGFLKITGGDNPLDATWIHPESYATASRVMEKLASTPGDLVRREGAESLAQRTGQQDVAALVEELGVGALLLTDILAQFARPGRDPREDLPAPVFKHGVLKLEDLESGMELTGTVLNVVDFGAFVDIGMHDSGLVHVSQLADKFVRDPHDVIAVGDVVKVWVVEVDKARRRVSLTMIAPGTQRTGRRREGQPADGRDADRAKRPAGPQRPASGQRAAGSERSRSERRPRPKGPPRDRGKRPPKSQYRPPKPRKPVTPITDEMKAGKEPMRTFGDLAQFFGPASPAPEPRPGRKRKPQKAKEEAKPAKTETEPPKTETDPSAVAPEPATETPEPTEQAQTPEQEAASGQDEAQAPSEQVQGADDAAQTPSSEQAVSGVDDQTTEEPPQTAEDPPENTEP
ncbi:MAG: helix-hairpin-helix domain-containing protein [Planctomycetes bacterium]|nr:helix-hairpin-helix domain-containing protein [Planctomycetota bacterium]